MGSSDGVGDKSTTSSPISYEPFAPRSESQRSRLSRIAVLTAGPTGRVDGDSSSSSDKAKDDALRRSSLLVSAVSGASSVGVPPNLPHPGRPSPPSDALGSALRAATARRARSSARAERSAAVRARLSDALRVCRALTDRHAELLDRSGELSAAADRLQHEEATLTRHAARVGDPLRRFDALDEVGSAVGVLFKDEARTVVRGSARIKVDAPEYAEALDHVDDARRFFRRAHAVLTERNALGLDKRELQRQRYEGVDVLGRGCVVEYHRRAVALQDAALSLVREAVVDRIQQATKDVSTTLDLKRTPVPVDKLEASLIYTRFHGISSRSNALVSLLRTRAGEDEDAVVDVEEDDDDDAVREPYRALLRRCEAVYAASREQLLKTTVRTHMDNLKRQHGLINMTRLSSVFLIRLCNVETSLYLDFFGGDRKSKEAGENNDSKDKDKDEKEKTDDDDDEPNVAKLPPHHSSHQQQQRRVSTARSSNKLARLAVEDAAFQTTLGNLGSFLHRTVRRGLITVHDLDTLGQIVGVLREEWTSANASSHTLAVARSLSGVLRDAQERLIFCANMALQREVVRYRPTEEDLDWPNHDRSEPKGEEDAAAAANNNENATAEEDDDAVRAQLRVYDSWFPPMRSVLRVLSKIFRVVEPAVFEDLAQQSVGACTRVLKEAASAIAQKNGEVLDADLFLVKHLLLFREQLSPFDIELRAVERQLDFSDTGRAVTKFLANRNRKLLSMTNENALVTLLREGVSVSESDVDSKRDLEDSLRSACNDFIEHASRALAGRLLAVEGLRGGGRAPAPAVRDALQEVAEGVGTRAEDLATRMAARLDNAATRGILARPVVRRVSRALDDCRRRCAAAEEKTNDDDGDDDDDGWRDDDVRTQIKELVADVERQIRANTALS